MNKNKLVLFLLFSLLALAGTCLANTAQSGPYSVSIAASISPVGSHVTTTPEGTNITSHLFGIGNGVITVAEYPPGSEINITSNLRRAFLADDSIDQDNIGINKFAMDGRHGVTAQAFSPKEKAAVFIGMYMIDAVTQVTIVNGDSRAFHDAIGTIRVEKTIPGNGQPSNFIDNASPISNVQETETARINMMTAGIIRPEPMRSLQRL